jgi:hypothetical protein
VTHLLNCEVADFSELCNRILSQGRHLRFQARGYCMRPFIRDGDVLEVEPASGWEVRVGDVMLYRSSEGKIVVHRVVKRYSGERVVLLAKGDSVPGLGQRICADQVLGKVAAIERRQRRIRFDSALRRLMGVFYAKFFPLSRRGYATLGRLKRAIGDCTVYNLGGGIHAKNGDKE